MSSDRDHVAADDASQQRVLSPPGLPTFSAPSLSSMRGRSEHPGPIPEALYSLRYMGEPDGAKSHPPGLHPPSLYSLRYVEPHSTSAQSVARKNSGGATPSPPPSCKCFGTRKTCKFVNTLRGCSFGQDCAGCHAHVVPRALSTIALQQGDQPHTSTTTVSGGSITTSRSSLSSGGSLRSSIESHNLPEVYLEDGAISRGAIYHRSGMCTPCPFFHSRRGCKDGVGCRNCHGYHENMTVSAARKIARRAAIERTELMNDFLSPREFVSPVSSYGSPQQQPVASGGEQYQFYDPIEFPDSVCTESL